MNPMTVLHDTARTASDTPPEAPRLVNVQEGEPSPTVVRVGHRHPDWRDVYHVLLTVRWHTFLAAVLLSCVFRGIVSTDFTAS